MGALTPLTLELPWPPSVNHYYRRVGPRTLISRAGREFRQRVCGILAARRLPPLTGRIAVSVEAYPPDRRPRDEDNLLKALIDSLQNGGVFPDDRQIIWLLIYGRQVVPGGRVVVRIREMGAGQEPPQDAEIWSPSWN